MGKQSAAPVIPDKNVPLPLVAPAPPPVRPMQAVSVAFIHPLQSVGEMRNHIKVDEFSQLEPNEIGIVVRLMPPNKRKQTFLVPFSNILAIEME